MASLKSMIFSESSGLLNFSLAPIFAKISALAVSQNRGTFEMQHFDTKLESTGTFRNFLSETLAILILFSLCRKANISVKVVFGYLSNTTVLIY